jgi:hypothetical protein
MENKVTRIYVLQVECEKGLMESVDEVVAVAATSIQMVTHTVMPDILSFEDETGDFYGGLHKRLTYLKAAGGNEQ